MHDQVTDEENDQHPWPDVDNVPVDPPDPPEPPDRTMKWRDEPPSAELEGDWEVPVSCNTGLTAGETEASGPSIGDEDPRNWPKGMQDVSECECEPLKWRSRKYSPEGGSDDQGDPSDKVHMSGVSGCQEVAEEAVEWVEMHEWMPEEKRSWELT